MSFVGKTIFIFSCGGGTNLSALFSLFAQLFQIHSISTHSSSYFMFCLKEAEETNCVNRDVINVLTSLPSDQLIMLIHTEERMEHV